MKQTILENIPIASTIILYLVVCAQVLYIKKIVFINN